MAREKKPLRCGKCGHKIGVVRVKPVFQKKLLMYGIAIAFCFEMVSNLASNLILKAIGL